MLPQPDSDGRFHVVALSGGKDSTALALRLAEIEPRPYSFVCTPTGDELPPMIEHWRKLNDLLKTTILPVSSGQSLSGLIRRQVALPNFRMRWCTRMLKLEPYYRFLDTLAARGEVVSYVGLRADEEGRAGMEFPEGGNISVRFPMKEWGWGISHVFEYLDSKGIDIPERTDCARCYHQTLGEWWRLWQNYPDIFQHAEAEEAWVSEQRGKKHTLRSEQRDTWPADLAGLRQRFEAGDKPRGLNKPRRGMCRVCSL